MTMDQFCPLPWEHNHYATTSAVVIDIILLGIHRCGELSLRSQCSVFCKSRY